MVCPLLNKLSRKKKKKKSLDRFYVTHYPSKNCWRSILCPLMLRTKQKQNMTTYTQRDLPHHFPLPSIFLSAAARRAFCSLLLAATHYSACRGASSSPPLLWSFKEQRLQRGRAMVLPLTPTGTASLIYLAKLCKTPVWGEWNRSKTSVGQQEGWHCRDVCLNMLRCSHRTNSINYHFELHWFNAMLFSQAFLVVSVQVATWLAEDTAHVECLSCQIMWRYPDFKMLLLIISKSSAASFWNIQIMLLKLVGHFAPLVHWMSLGVLPNKHIH